MVTNETCVLTFLTSPGKQKSVRINNPRPGITAEALTAAAETFTQFNVFDSSVGSLTQLVGANVITQKTIRLI
ncbi:MAG: DUF2922 domain-containing protein [Defluviitaleaceae bacterium]|nr:DUF2922 domain-containing protein [Defluviitaleaceae bacterium]